MKKLGIYAHQRSGSSILYEVMSDSTLTTTKDRCGIPLGECFTPSDTASLVEVNGTLWRSIHGQLLEHEIQDRDVRLEYMKQHNYQDYFIKVFGIDLHHNGIREYVSENYELIAIERRNSLSAVLSGIVAIQHWFFNVDSTIHKPIPNYSAFVARYQNFSYMTDALISYYKYKDELDIHKTYIYEDIVNMGRRDILSELNLGDTVVPSLPLRKLLTFDQKVDLIQNYDEVLFWYKTDLEPFLPEDRRGGYS